MRLNQFSSITQSGLSLGAGALLKFLGRQANHFCPQRSHNNGPLYHTPPVSAGNRQNVHFAFLQLRVSERMRERATHTHQFHASNLASARINHSMGARKTKDAPGIPLRGPRTPTTCHSLRQERQHIVARFYASPVAKKYDMGTLHYIQTLPDLPCT